jgi:hypothetical protein
VIEKGRIAAEGTHAALLAESPIYREIFDSQLGDAPDSDPAAGANPGEDRAAARFTGGREGNP